MVITDRTALRPVRVGVELASALLKLFPGKLEIDAAATAVRLDGGPGTTQSGRGSGRDRRELGGCGGKVAAAAGKYLLY